jgi:hypothetical protein
MVHPGIWLIAKRLVGGGVQGGFSNGQTICDIGGPFVDIGGGGGVGGRAGADYYAGATSDGRWIQGGTATFGPVLGGSASAQRN